MQNGEKLVQVLLVLDCCLKLEVTQVACHFSLKQIAQYRLKVLCGVLLFLLVYIVLCPDK